MATGTTLGSLVKMNGWHEAERSLDGRAVVDDDPDSSNNQPGLFGIEIEAATEVSVRSIRLKKLNWRRADPNGWLSIRDERYYS